MQPVQIRYTDYNVKFCCKIGNRSLNIYKLVYNISINIAEFSNLAGDTARLVRVKHVGMAVKYHSYLEPYFQFPDIMRHAVDIAVVAYVLYKLMLLIRETRAEQSFEGPYHIVVCHLVERSVKPAYYLYDTQEYRTVGCHCLADCVSAGAQKSAGTNRQRKIFDKVAFNQNDENISEVIDNIVGAVQSLQALKLVPLLLSKEKQGLMMLSKQGQGWMPFDPGAAENIFVPNTPLHDGAVIIRESRVIAAGCFYH